MRTLQPAIVVALILAFAARERAISQEPFLMPESFRDVQTGMPLDRFLSTRTNAHVFTLLPDHATVTNRTKQMFIEHIVGHPLFDEVLYGFRTNVLDTLVFAGRIDGASQARRGDGFFAALVSAWGTPDQFDVVDLDDGKGSSKSPALLWLKNGQLVAGSLTPVERLKATGRGSVQLTIQRLPDGESGSLSNLFVRSRVSDAQRGAILAPVQKALDNRQSDPSIGGRETQ